jgi:hypothetical protein
MYPGSLRSRHDLSQSSSAEPRQADDQVFVDGAAAQRLTNSKVRGEPGFARHGRRPEMDPRTFLHGKQPDIESVTGNERGSLLTV